MLTSAVVYDIEVFPNVFTLSAMALDGNTLPHTLEISEYKDDRKAIATWFDYLFLNKTHMIGFNNLNYDYPIIHFIYKNMNTVTNACIYKKSMEIINGNSQFSSSIWESDRFAPQIDLFKIHHFDNMAKATSLKSLEINMQALSVMDMPVKVGSTLTRDEIDRLLIPYNHHDVIQTTAFAKISLPMIEFRVKMKGQLKGDVLNFNDTKIGKELLTQRLGDVCFDYQSGRKTPRQTVRNGIKLNDIIFPYIRFDHPEFNRILQWFKEQEIHETKGVFQDVIAAINGFQFVFGAGGIHGSVTGKTYLADADFTIQDDDVISLYPSISIVNRLYPEHLGDLFVKEYANLKAERLQYKKGTVENAALKLALNGVYGDSNNPYSVFYDPQYTMKITINGQLMLCMLAEKLLDVPTLEIIQINTDGITYRVHRSMLDYVACIKKHWESYTMLDLENAEYNRVWIKDVNNYIAETSEGKIKEKGVYFTPRSIDDIQASGAWHKNFSNLASVRAAKQFMFDGSCVRKTLLENKNLFDFMLRTKVNRSCNLMLGNREIQRVSRYYISHDGAALKKISPPTLGNKIGEYKRNSKCTDQEWCDFLMPGQHDERIHTKNRSKHELRETSIEAGFLASECNNVESFSWFNLNFDYYENQAKKLIIGT